MTRRLNLLPPERRAALLRAQLLGSVQRVLRLVLGGLLLLLFTGAGLGIGLRLLLPTVSPEAARALQQQQQAYGELRDTITHHNTLIAALARAGDERIAWGRVIHGVVAVLPPGVTLATTVVDDASLTLTISGTAPDRAVIVELAQRLDALPWVASSRAPRDNLIERVDSPFQFELLIDAAAAREAAAL